MPPVPEPLPAPEAEPSEDTLADPDVRSLARTDLELADGRYLLVYHHLEKTAPADA